MSFQIISTSRRILASGIIRGSIIAKHEGRRYTVKYQRDTNGHAEQWGAPTEVLYKTYSTFEELTTPPEY